MECEERTMAPINGLQTVAQGMLGEQFGTANPKGLNKGMVTNMFHRINQTREPIVGDRVCFDKQRFLDSVSRWAKSNRGAVVDNLEDGETISDFKNRKIQPVTAFVADSIEEVLSLPDDGHPAVLTLVITAGPGSGKSTIAQKLTEDMEQGLDEQNIKTLIIPVDFGNITDELYRMAKEGSYQKVNDLNMLKDASAVMDLFMGHVYDLRGQYSSMKDYDLIVFMPQLIGQLANCDPQGDCSRRLPFQMPFASSVLEGLVKMADRYPHSMVLKGLNIAPDPKQIQKTIEFRSIRHQPASATAKQTISIWNKAISNIEYWYQNMMCLRGVDREAIERNLQGFVAAYLSIISMTSGLGGFHTVYNKYQESSCSTAKESVSQERNYMIRAMVEELIEKAKREERMLIPVDN